MEVSSLFAKKKGKKKKGINLNLDEKSIIQQVERERIQSPSPRAVPGTEVEQQPDDDGWLDTVEKKKVVANVQGRKVTELIDMDKLRSAEQSIREKVERQDIQAQLQAVRIKKEEEGAVAEEEDQKVEEAPKEEKKASGLASFGGGGWRERAKKKEEEQRKITLDSGNSEAFPELGGGPAPVAKPSKAPTGAWGGGGNKVADEEEGDELGEGEAQEESDEAGAPTDGEAAAEGGEEREPSPKTQAAKDPYATEAPSSSEEEQKGGKKGGDPYQSAQEETKVGAAAGAAAAVAVEAVSVSVEPEGETKAAAPQTEETASEEPAAEDLLKMMKKKKKKKAEDV